jgi:hypothetical protein
MSELEVIVKFGKDIPPSIQGPALLNLEKFLRSETKQDCRVFKDRMSDDSKLRVRMTPEERDKL